MKFNLIIRFSFSFIRPWFFPLRNVKENGKKTMKLHPVRWVVGRNIFEIFLKDLQLINDLNQLDNMILLQPNSIKSLSIDYKVFYWEYETTSQTSTNFLSIFTNLWRLDWSKYIYTNCVCIRSNSSICIYTWPDSSVC